MQIVRAGSTPPALGFKSFINKKMKMMKASKQILDVEKKLYHFTDEASAEGMFRDGCIKPSEPGQHLSVNEDGRFEGRRLRNFNFGYSNVPNVYFVDDGSPMSVVSIGQSLDRAEYRFETTVGEIMKQGLKVFRPWPITWFVYNVPCPNSQTLLIDTTKYKHFEADIKSLRSWGYVLGGLLLYAVYKPAIDFVCKPIKKSLENKL